MKAATQLRTAGVPCAYEETVIKYEVPATRKRYTADFRLPSGIVVETKGMFVSADRAKHKLIKAQHPDIDIRIVFMRPNSTIGKKSTTSYSKWCDDHGIRWAKAASRDNPIPQEWLGEPPNEKSIAALRKLEE